MGKPSSHNLSRRQTPAALFEAAWHNGGHNGIMEGDEFQEAVVTAKGGETIRAEFDVCWSGICTWCSVGCDGG